MEMNLGRMIGMGFEMEIITWNQAIKLAELSRKKAEKRRLKFAKQEAKENQNERIRKR